MSIQCCNVSSGIYVPKFNLIIIIRIRYHYFLRMVDQYFRRGIRFMELTSFLSITWTWRYFKTARWFVYFHKWNRANYFTGKPIRPICIISTFTLTNIKKWGFKWIITFTSTACFLILYVRFTKISWLLLIRICYY
jgi:hypothetical protein